MKVSEATETELREQLAEIELLYMTAPVGLALVDRNHRFVRVNDQLALINGKTAAEHIGQSLRDVIPEIADEVEALHRRVIETGEPILDVVSHGVTAAEPLVPRDWLASYHPVKSENGLVRGVSVAVLDVTDRKRAEEELRLLQAITLSVSQAEDLDSALHSVLGNVSDATGWSLGQAWTPSHEGTVLECSSAWHSSGAGLEKFRGSSEGFTFSPGVGLLDDLIEDLLAYSRLDAKTASSIEVNLPALVDAILRDRAPVIAERGVEISMSISAPTVRAWERGLAQALANLIDNAIKYIRDSKPPRVVITAEEVADAYRIIVKDNGIGFDIKYQDRIFGLFNRLVRAEEFEGTGAGLAIAKKVVEKQGGKIWAEAQPGVGATFFVELPKHTNEGG